MFFKNSKPLIGFDDKFLVFSGILINTMIAVSIFYQGALYRVPFHYYFPKWLEYFVFITFSWVFFRGLYLYNLKKFKGIKGERRKWLFLPLFSLPFIIVASIYYFYVTPLLDYQIPGYETPMLRDVLVTGSLILMIDVSIYILAISNYALNRTRIEEERLKKENAVNQLKSLQNQLSPHFLFNSLNTLLFLIDEDKNKSKDFVHKLTFLYKKLLEFSDRDLITIQEELEHLTAYVDLLHRRFDKNFKVTIDISENCYQQKIIPFSTQVSVENAVKHNIISNSKPLKILIKSSDSYIIVENNLQPKETKPESSGIGIKNIEDRYKILTDRDLKIEKDEEKFILKIPIIKA